MTIARYDNPSTHPAGQRQPTHVLLVDEQGTPIVGAIKTSWSQTHRPAANTQATATQPAPGLGKRLVCTGLTVTLVAGAVAPTATTINVSLIDGATGGTTYKWGTVLGMPAVAGATNGVAKNGPFVGSLNTPLTLEFSAAAGANTVESISFEGIVIEEGPS